MDELYTTKIKKGISNVLVGSSTAIVVVIVSTGIYVNIFNALKDYPVFSNLIYLLKLTTLLLPFVVGFFIARQFDLDPMRSSLVGATALVAGGSIKIIEEGRKIFDIEITGVGDIINIILISAVAVLFIKLIKDRLGSYTLIFLPILVVAGIGLLGIYTLDYVVLIVGLIGKGVQYLTELTPVLMCSLICAVFVRL